MRCRASTKGCVSVQDAGAQRAAELLDAQPGERVLDACAAPGGKTGHILERAGGELDLTALDCDAAAAGAGARESRAPRATTHDLIAARSRCRRLVGRPTVRSHPAGCAVLRNRRDPPPSGHQAAAPGRRHRRLRRHPAAAAGTLRGAAGRRAAAWSTRPVRSCRRRTRNWSSASCGRHQRFRRSAARRAAAAAARAQAGRGGAHRRLLLCLPHQGGRGPVRSAA